MKKRMFVVLIYLLIGAALFAAIGDVDNDGFITIVDGLLTAQYYVGMQPANFNRSNGDVNKDGAVDIVDALLMAQIYVGLIDLPEDTSDTIALQAEDAFYNDGLVESEYPGYTGSGYVNTANQIGSYLEWTINLSQSGNSDWSFTFANGSTSSRPMSISVNGSIVVSRLDFPATNAWDVWSVVKSSFYLESGINTIRLTSLASEGAPNLDKADVASLGEISLTTPEPTVTLPPTATPEPVSTPDNSESVIGFASMGSGTTGGAGGAVVTVTDSSSFKSALNSSDPLIIQVQGIISISVVVIQNKANKTIQGIGTRSGWKGNIQFKRCSNFIIKNMNLSAPSNGDAMTIQNESNHFWIDHCALGDCSDGQIDITHGSDYITISWTSFSYTDSSNDHRFSCLIGHDDDNASEDRGKLHVTFHHNMWGRLCHERMPRLRYGQVHLFNNYYNASGNNYCASSRIEGQMLIENNYFQGVSDPWDAQQGGRVKASGNTLDNCRGSSSPKNDSVFSPPYSYHLESPGDARSKILASVGPR